MDHWRLETITVGPLQMNAYLLIAEMSDGGAPEAALIDPGEEADRLLAAVDAAGCRLTTLLATHGHFDHVAVAAAIQKRCDLPLLCHRGDVAVIELMPEVQRAYGFPPTPVPRLAPELPDRGKIPFGGGELQVRHVPGHSPGHVMFSWPGHALVGDCVFAGSIGRTDLPGGDFTVLERSIRERIYTLDDGTVLHPGHGPDTTVGREKTSNPFVRES